MALQTGRLLHPVTVELHKAIPGSEAILGIDGHFPSYSTNIDPQLGCSSIVAQEPT